MHHGTRSRLGLALALAVCLSPSAARAAVINISDGEMSNGNWSETAFTNGGGAQGTTHQTLGGSGDNGAYRQTLHSVPGGFIFVNVFHTTNVITYNPATQGDILSLTFSIDYNTFENVVGTGFVVEQAGNFWYGFYDALFTSGQWLTRTSDPLTAADFLGAGSPDFSANGAPITFGYNTANSSTGGGYSTTSGYDNFTLTILHDPSTALYAPEPASLALLAPAMLAFRRRG